MSEKDYSKKRKSYPIKNDGPSLVRPEFKSQSSIHNILKRGIPQPTMPQIFSDNFNIGDKIDTFLKVKSATEKFNSLPADARKYFDNNPARLIDAIESKNYKSLIAAGIISEIPKDLPNPNSPDNTQSKDT